MVEEHNPGTVGFGFLWFYYTWVVKDGVWEEMTGGEVRARQGSLVFQISAMRYEL
jgi:hypothetical protein